MGTIIPGIACTRLVEMLLCTFDATSVICSNWVESDAWLWYSVDSFSVLFQRVDRTSRRFYHNLPQRTSFKIRWHSEWFESTFVKMKINARKTDFERWGPQQDTVIVAPVSLRTGDISSLVDKYVYGQTPRCNWQVAHDSDRLLFEIAPEFVLFLQDVFCILWIFLRTVVNVTIVYNRI